MKCNLFKLLLDFNLNKSNDIKKTIDMYVKYYNNERPSYSLKYKTPSQFKTDMGF